ncbi:hypothetical protein MDAP_001827 [Mitosporidium daphniae]|uniref:Translationally-controlled tumor protein homolog n=1 Tax=Mitosporidium daphniae TaxID=1485682 RepID=A0A098VY42_9MICR|nr:translationally controlled tumor protein [Mitosporidium daphniae]KGG52696.1 translationally controlled tumor protein [Mitosporidium daphniae]|eukprot:XP_013239132.1 translationally controlled tumor protein [Mitosporidium daphniae]
MLLYKDVITKDELASDSFCLKDEGFFYRIQTNYINKAGLKIDIGANPSAEGADADEGVCDSTSGDIVNDFIDSFRLQETSFDKKSYQHYIRGYLKAIKAYLSEKNATRVSEFEDLAKVHVRNIIENIDDFKFFNTESMDPDGMIIIMGYEDESKPPYALLFKDGCYTEKI